MKKKSRQITYFKFRKFYFFIIIFIIIFSGLYLFRQYSILKEHENYIYELNNKIKDEEELNKELKKENEYKNSDEYIEKIARDKLGMVKSNEIIFYDLNK